MRNRLTEAMKTHDVEYADIRIEDKTHTWVNFRGPDLDSIGSARVVGGIVRALYKGGWGYATFNDLDDLAKRVREACEIARLVGRDKSYFAPVKPVVDTIDAHLIKDFREVPLIEKKVLAEEYNRIILGHHSSIQTSRVLYNDSFKTIWYANSEGTYIEEEVPDVNLWTNAIAREGDIVQKASETCGGTDGYQSVENFHEKAREAAQKAVELVAAAPVTGGKYTVIIDPILTGVFTHEAFGHLSESDFVYENPRMQEIMQLGKRFGVSGLNIIDDGSLTGGLGTHCYDYEGVPTRKNYLIKDGILVGRLHSRETAAKMGEPVSGNARAVHFQHSPIVRMTNTYIDQGMATFENMLKDIELGIYAVKLNGGHTELEMFTFSAAYGYMIRNGRVAELVRGTDIFFAGHCVGQKKRNIDAEGIAAQAIEYFRMAENSAPIESGEMQVIFTPFGLIALLLSLGLAVDGKNVLLGASPLRDKLGRLIAGPGLTIVDNPFIEYGTRTSAFDDEGTPRKITPLIEKGVLRNFIYDRDTAGRAGIKPTGHGSNRHLTNLIIDPGDTAFKTMIANIRHGMLVHDFLGLGQGNPINGDFSVNVFPGYKIENGELVGRVKDVMLSGNAFNALKNIIAISREREEVSGSWAWYAGLMPYVQVDKLNVTAK